MSLVSTAELNLPKIYRYLLVLLWAYIPSQLASIYLSFTKYASRYCICCIFN